MEKSVGGVIVKDGKVVVVKQQKGTFSLPKGHLEGNERLIDTAYREIYEETGLKKEDLKLLLNNRFKKIKIYSISESSFIPAGSAFTSEVSLVR
jgi:ADP-ribose pyrophosphatase YjhB (NUDIX family)